MVPECASTFLSRLLLLLKLGLEGTGLLRTQSWPEAMRQTGTAESVSAATQALTTPKSMTPLAGSEKARSDSCRTVNGKGRTVQSLAKCACVYLYIFDVTAKSTVAVRCAAAEKMGTQTYHAELERALALCVAITSPSLTSHAPSLQVQAASGTLLRLRDWRSVRFLWVVPPFVVSGVGDF